MTREEKAVEILKALLTTNEFSYNSTGEAVYDAVELTDLLEAQLARPVGTVKIENYDDEQEEAEEAAEVVNVSETTETVKKRNLFGF